MRLRAHAPRMDVPVVTRMIETPTLEVIRLGHPVLRKRAEILPEDLFDSAELEELNRKLIATMASEGGVGLAAPQVAESLRCFVYWVPESDEEPESSPCLLANPLIRPIGEEIKEGWEGCLSVPGLRGLVPRYRRIKVKARLLDGAPISFTADGFRARVIQHEYDHLDGIVYLDRMESPASLAFEEEWERYILGDGGGDGDD